MTKVFKYAVDYRFAPMWAPFGFRPWKDAVSITDDERFVATFGFFKLQTPVANITEAHITRGYRWWTPIGARGSFVDDGLTFGTNRDAGVCVHFGDKVSSALSRKGHSALTVTIAELDELVLAVGH